MSMLHMWLKIKLLHKKISHYCGWKCPKLKGKFRNHFASAKFRCESFGKYCCDACKQTVASLQCIKNATKDN